jgi:hypothetical protein
MDIALSSYWYLHLEGQAVWVVYQSGDGVEDSAWFRGLLGVGFGL